MKLSWNDFPEYWDDDNKLNQISLSFPSNYYENHIFIEGDNYPVLKLISNQYKNIIDLIYIDPPYNTGNTFTYNDNFSTKNDLHSSWLSFMKRRLSIAKELLKENGCIFIAIDQSELYVLKLLCDEIFGEINFVNDFMWLHGKGKKDSWSRTLQQHTLCYAKNKSQLKPFVEIENTNWAKNNIDQDPRGNWFSGSISFSEKRSNKNHKNFYSVKSPSGKIWERQWLCSKEEMNKLLKDNKIYFGKAPDYDKVPRIKIFNSEQKEIIPKNIINNVETTKKAEEHVEKILGLKNIFDNPKPVDLISHLIEISQTNKNGIIMDFFAGSGTTFESVLKLNKKDGGNRKTILVQKAEIPQTNNKIGTIADICWKRLLINAKQYNINNLIKLICKEY